MITYGEKSLFGIAGGQLEYVSQRVEDRQNEATKKWYKVMIVRFTDHDLQANPLPNNDELIDGIYYELEFPLA